VESVDDTMFEDDKVSPVARLAPSPASVTNALKPMVPTAADRRAASVDTKTSTNSSNKITRDARQSGNRSHKPETFPGELFPRENSP